LFPIDFYVYNLNFTFAPLDPLKQCEAHIRLEIEIEIGLEFNQSEEKIPISSLVNFALIGQNPI